MNTIDIARMDKTQKLQTMEAIWDSLIHEATELESPDWHRDVLVERTNRLEQGKAEFFAVDEIRSRLKK
jgi:hypothetical protein